MADPSGTTDVLTMSKCPFCGADPTLKKRISLFGDKGIRIDWSIECENCYKADGGKTYRTWYEVTDDELLKKLNPEKEDDVPDGRAKVITAWNKRASDVKQPDTGTKDATDPNIGSENQKVDEPGGEDTGTTTPAEGDSTGSQTTNPAEGTEQSGSSEQAEQSGETTG